LNIYQNENTSDAIKKYKEKFDDVVPMGRKDLFRNVNNTSRVLGFNKLKGGNTESMLNSMVTPIKADHD
jgi:hypothetical protein